VRVIEPRTGSIRERIVDAWTYRHLVVFFARRQLEKRYRRTMLGWIWLPLRPSLDVGMRAFVFGGLLGVQSGSTPYLLFLLVGMSAWFMFERTLFWSMRSIDLNRGLLSRVYVPRLVPLVSAIAPGLVEYLTYCGIVLIAAAYYFATTGVMYLRYDYGLVQALVGLVLLVGLALSVGLWLAPLAAKTRDVRFAMRYVLSIWTYVTPVLYPLQSLHGLYRTFAALNPATAPLEMVKSGIIQTGSFGVQNLLVTCVAIAILSTSGLWFFSRSEAGALDRL
jgi:lipopolysaccharide transport system permease protein